MAKIGVWIEKPAVKAGILCSQEMAALLSSEARRICAEAGEGYTYTVQEESTRLCARIYAGSESAEQDNSDNNTLVRYV